jgi:exodeoxyribonuclease V beta subunit
VNAPRILDAATLPLQGRHLIEASAGTGKTHTLTDLYLRLVVENGRAVEQILVVTFTKAATAEMKTRIRRRLLQARDVFTGARRPVDPVERALWDGAADPAQCVRQLDAALMGFDRAAVFTLHGFCLSALRDHAFSAGLPTHLTLSAEEDAAITRTARDLWRRLEGALDDPCRAFGLRRAGLTPMQLLEDLRLRQRHPLAQLNPLPLSPQSEELTWADLEAALQTFQTRWRDGGGEVRHLLLDSPALNRTTYKPEKITRWCDALGRLGKMPALDLDALQLLDEQAKDWAALTPLGLAGRIKKGHAAPEHPLFEAIAGLLDAWERMGEAWQAAVRSQRRDALEEAVARLQADQQRRGEMGLSDLTLRLRTALQGAGGDRLASALRARFPVALIDEFQDTDPAQFDVFRALYPDPTGTDGTALVLIGDPKQAIYGFRGADVHAYLAARGELGVPWVLAHNWRSVPPLIAGVNAVFSGREDPFRLPGIRFYAVKPGREDGPQLTAPGSTAALQFALLPGSTDAPLNKGEANQAAAEWTAAEIARLLAAAARGEACLGERPLRGGDVAVLVRTHGQGQAVADALRAHGVSFARRTQESVYATTAAQDLERVLRAVLMPTRLNWLKGALATVLLDGTLPSILELDQDELALERLLERFQSHHETWQRRGFMPMWQSLMAAHGVAARLLARSDGERMLTNVQHLAELLHDAEMREHLGPEALFNRLATLRQSPEQGGEAALLRLESEDDLVRIETIHVSKGLQYPVVFCPTLWCASKTVDSARPGMLCYHDPEHGEARLELAPEIHPAAREQAELELLGEDLRLAYVALTRAQARCYVVDGSIKERDRSALGWLLPGAEPNAAWAQRAPGCPEAIGAWMAVAPVDGDALAVPVRPTVVARIPQRRVPPPRVVTSFSALWGGVSEAVADHDDRTGGPGGVFAPLEPSPHGFPRGASAGRALHAILERWSWAEGTGALAALTREALAQEGLARHWEPVVVDWLQQVVNTPLGTDGLRLAQVLPAQQAREMAFAFPLDGLDRRRLDALIARADPLWTARGYHAPPVLDGALRGFIDLVFAHEGRYYLVDYKSNWLGPQAGDYTPEALAVAMAGGGYTAQALIYALALHRHLRSRLPDYDVERDFGGVHYLFLRGMAPDAPGRGVMRLYPDRATLAQLDALVAGRREA